MANSTIKCYIKVFTFGVLIQTVIGEDISPDFIIVGGGTSGCVVAGRLSEKYSVLLLEAGGEPDDLFDIPAKVFGSWVWDKYVDHAKIYTSTYQENAAQMSPFHGHIDYTIGTKLGGGSAINAMIYNRGSPHDYNNWANITNDPSWNYENLLKYLKKIEDYQGGFPSEEHHGTGGPLPISTSNYVPGQEAWFKAGEWLGYPTNLDPNGPQVPSFTPIEFTTRNGRRVSSYNAYVEPHLKTRPNLKIVTNAEVTRINFNEDKSRAIGVTYTKKYEDGSKKLTVTVEAKKEVILSAGTLDSPTILMRSGIGPKEVLEDSNIDIVKVLPVGYNLQDHITTKLEFHLNKEVASKDVVVPERDLNEENLKLFEETGEGPFSSMSGFHGQAFLVSKIRKREPWPNAEWADIEFLQAQTHDYLMTVPADKEDGKKDYVKVFVFFYLARPKSKGRVILDKDNADGPPVVDFNFLSDLDGHDMEIYLEAVKTIIDMYENSPTFKSYGTRFSDIVYEPCGHFEFRSDEYFKCFIRHVVVSGLHASGTCRMGSGRGDENAVVDVNLKVIGVEGLRVVDLSIMPDITNANTMAPAYLIGEKAVDMILKEWNGEREEL